MSTRSPAGRDTDTARRPYGDAMTRTASWARLWSIVRLAAALLIAAAIVRQLVASVETTLELDRDLATVLVNFFSFFTILSNVIAAVVLAWAGIVGLRPGSDVRESRALATALVCASTYMIITGIVYNTLLRSIELPQGSQPVWWSNEVLHLVGPLFLLLDLFFGSRRRALPWRRVGVVIIFPLVWVAYTLVRGPLVTNPATGVHHWYPYPFLDSNGPGGWPSVILYVIVIAVAFVIVGAGVVWIGRRRARVDATEPADPVHL